MIIFVMICNLHFFARSSSLPLQIFDYLRENNLTVLKKIIPIEVDYDAYNLGLMREKIYRIHSEVEVMLGRKISLVDGRRIMITRITLNFF